MDPYEMGMAPPTMPLLSDRRGVGKQFINDPRLMQGLFVDRISLEKMFNFVLLVT